jgi:hypothetical protein
MLLATWGQAAGLLALLAAVAAPLVALFVVLGRFARRNWRRGEIPQAVLGRLGQLVICGLGVAGLPFVLLALLAIGCPPDAFECPA